MIDARGVQNLQISLVTLPGMTSIQTIWKAVKRAAIESRMLLDFLAAIQGSLH